MKSPSNGTTSADRPKPPRGRGLWALPLSFVLGMVSLPLLLPEGWPTSAFAQGGPNLTTLGAGRADARLTLSLDARRRELDTREAALDRREEQLAEAAKQAEAKISEMATLRTELDALLTAERQRADKKFKEMASIHQSMPTLRSAELLAATDDAVAVGILTNLPDERVAKVLAKMPAERALSLSQAYMGLRKTAQVPPATKAPEPPPAPEAPPTATAPETAQKP